MSTQLLEVKRHLVPMLTRDCRTASPELIEAFVRALEAEGPASAEAAAILRDSSMGHEWNDALSYQRAEVLARHLSPLLHGRIADVLAGDGSLTAALSHLGHDIAAFERAGAYPPKGFFEIQDLPALTRGFPCDTLLISTVLHHEPDVEALLNRCSSLGARRWVVVENCITPEVSAGFHEFIDIVFNQCLNNFAIDIPSNHSTVAGWEDILSSFGDVRHAVRLNAVPGVPFPYDIFEVTLE